MPEQNRARNIADVAGVVAVINSNLMCKTIKLERQNPDTGTIPKNGTRFLNEQTSAKSNRMANSSKQKDVDFNLINMCPELYSVDESKVRSNSAVCGYQGHKCEQEELKDALFKNYV
ncbi:Hypothetical predicted protein [Octopus vulgaris]|uniref:Uncharacterized protein n=1 Tax=Octopus vulgaris TaxID=6645 RepID=A0AA36BAS1_OCTVU|nr:Hypothetical predicted protein [Octopus vulgaris]